MPVSAFYGVYVSSLPGPVQSRIKNTLEEYKRDGVERFFDFNDPVPVIESKIDPKSKKQVTVIVGYNYGLVKDEILLKSFDACAKKYGFKVDGFEISKNMFFEQRDNSNLHGENGWAHFDMYAKHGKAVNCNSAIGDIHLSTKRDIMLIDDAFSRGTYHRSHLDDATYVCTKCSWAELLQNGKFDEKNQQLEVLLLREFLNKRYRKRENNDNSELTV